MIYLSWGSVPALQALSGHTSTASTAPADAERARSGRSDTYSFAAQRSSTIPSDCDLPFCTLRCPEWLACSGRPGLSPAGPAAGRPPHGASARPGQPGGT